MKRIQMLPQNRCKTRLDPGLPYKPYVNQQLGSGMAFSEVEQASLPDSQQAMFSKRNKNVPPQGPHFPRPKYIPTEQVKLFRKLFSTLQPPQEPLMPLGKTNNKHFVLSCVTSEAG